MSTAAVTTATKTATTATGAPPSSGIASIDDTLQKLLSGGLTFTLFSVPFTTPLTFTGNVSVQVSSTSSATFSGTAQLGAPFDASFDVVVSVNTSGVWLVELTLPDFRSLATAVMRQVQDESAKTVFGNVVEPFLDAFSGAVIAIANKDTSDPEGRDVFSGINFFATFSPFTIKPLDSVATTFRSAVDLTQFTTSFHLACRGRSTQFAFTVEGNVQCDQALGTDAFRLQEVGLRLDQKSKDVNAGVTCRFQLTLGHDILWLTGDFLFDGTGAVTISLALDPADGAWEKPFGVDGVVVNSLGVVVGATDKAPYVILGMRVQAVVGSGSSALPLDGAVLFNGSDLEHSVISLSSSSRIALAALCSALGAPALSPVFDVAISDPYFYLSPEGATIAGKDYPRGVALGGNIDMWGFGASIYGELDDDELVLRGAIDPIAVTINGQSCLRLCDPHDTNTGPSLDLECGRQRQVARASIQITLFDHEVASVDLNLGSSTLAMIPLQAAAGSIYAGTAAMLQASQFRARSHSGPRAPYVRSSPAFA